MLRSVLNVIFSVNGGYVGSSDMTRRYNYLWGDGVLT